MKTSTTKFFSLILFISIASSNLTAQMFQLANGPISSTPSDSRSVNFLDVNNDGWEDIYISNGLSGGQEDLFYINDGTGQFTEVTNMEIVEASNPSDGASFADYNNDGHVDGSISSWYGAEDLLYLNDGNGNLNYNENAGIVPGSFAETASFGDYNNDGWLDLYITNSGGDKKNFLYKNLQDGTFERITDHILVSNARTSRGAIWGDFNNDNKIDLFVTNESNEANDMYLGQGGGVFEKYLTGNIVGSQRGSMTSSWGDIDNDCDLDVFVGNSAYFSAQLNQIFINEDGSFEERTEGPVVESNKCTYGSAMGDYDNDGDLDLIVANGFCSSGLTNILYENQGNGTFVDASVELGVNYNICSFGIAWGDVNNDGFLDLMVANCKNSTNDTENSNALLINEGNDNNWLKVKLIGVASNASAIGAKIKIKATIDGATVWQLREISAQTGYSGQNSMIAHFGLGDATQIDSMIINWPAGTTEVIETIDINQQLTLTEGMNTSLRGIDLSEFIQLAVFPNPVSKKQNEITVSIISAKSYKNSTLLVYDTLGQEQWSKAIGQLSIAENFSTPISSNNFSPGIYQVVLQTEEGSMSQKIVVY